MKNNNTQTCTAGACPGRKLSAPFLRCCVCMTWLHPQCVGDSKEDADVCGTWTCHKCRLVPSQISQLLKTTQQMSKDIQSIRQLQTSYSKLHNSLDAAYKNNQHLKLPTVNNFERRLLNLSHESSAIRLPASPASSTTSSSSSSFTSPSSTPSTPQSPVVSPRRDNVSQSQLRSGTLVIGDSLLRDIDGKQIRGVRVICKRGGYIADVKDLLLAQNKQYHHLILHVGTNDADPSLKTSDVLEEFRPLLEAAVARADVVSVSAL